MIIYVLNVSNNPFLHNYHSSPSIHFLYEIKTTYSLRLKKLQYSTRCINQGDQQIKKNAPIDAAEHSP
jgi:hypothetical protein